jgi:electron transfer flavoprotein alpha subunit
VTPDNHKAIWVFGDYRNYFQNRVTLQVLARARDLADNLKAQVSALVFGHQVDEWVGEYIAHGADIVYVVDHPSLEYYRIQTYTRLLELLCAEYGPEIILVGATGFGKELAARAASRLGTGLTADCIELSIDQNKRFVQTAPSFGGNLLAEIVMPQARPQMATVRPDTFQELPHDDERNGEIIHISLPADLPPEKVRLISSRRVEPREESLEKAKVVVCGGRGMGSAKKFKKLHELARLIGGEVAATRPVVYEGWAAEEVLVGQAGRGIRPDVLFSFGVSGAIQHTAGIHEAKFIVAINKNPGCTMMKMADVALVGDANQICLALIRELKQRLES